MFNVLQRIEDAKLELVQDEYFYWLSSAATIYECIFEKKKSQFFENPALCQTPEQQFDYVSDQRSTDIARLFGELEDVFGYATRGEMRVNGKWAEPKDFLPRLMRFLAIAEMTWGKYSVHRDDLKKFQDIEDRRDELLDQEWLSGDFRPVDSGDEMGQLFSEHSQMLEGHSYLDQTWDRGHCVLLSKHARARKNLGFKKRIQLEDIRLLAGMKSIRSVINATNLPEDVPAERRLIVDKGIDGKTYVSTNNAKTWLKERRGYIPTCSKLDLSENEIKKENSKGSSTDYIFVPVAKDGSLFDGKCESGEGYIVCRKGKDQYLENYLDALAALNMMSTPRWKRPNLAGQWGAVTAASWKRTTLQEVGVNEIKGDDGTILKY